MSQPTLKKYVAKAPKKKWSPDEIAGRSKQEFRQEPACQVSHQTIYNWLASEAPELRLHLRRGRRRSQPETPGQIDWRHEHRGAAEDCRVEAPRWRLGGGHGGESRSA